MFKVDPCIFTTKIKQKLVCCHITSGSIILNKQNIWDINNALPIASPWCPSPCIITFIPFLLCMCLPVNSIYPISIRLFSFNFPLRFSLLAICGSIPVILIIPLHKKNELFFQWGTVCSCLLTVTWKARLRFSELISLCTFVRLSNV